MYTRSDSPLEWLRRRAVAVFFPILVLTVLLILVWRQRPALLPSSGTPLPPAPEPKRWTQLSGLFAGKINALLVENPGGERVVYAGTDGGVFKSEDQGKQWIACNNGLSNRLVRAMASDPDDPNVLYAGTWNGRVHVSTDGGASWQERSHGLPPYEIRALAVHTYDPRKLYAGNPGGVFTTTNGGEEWHPASEFTGTLQCMAMDIEHPDTLYVGTTANGIYKSLDGGATWFSLRTAFTDVAALVIPARAPRTVYAISKGKIYRTENAGVLWTYVDSYRDPSVARCLAVNPKNAQEVYVGLADGLYKSNDARQTWYRSDAGLRGMDVQVLAVDPMEANIVYACTDNQLFISTDAGRTWEERSRINMEAAAGILALKGDPKDGKVFYASAEGGGLYKTADGGDHWEHVGESLPLAWITAIEVDPIDTRMVYAGIREGFVFKSKDGGATWVPAGGVTEALISALAVDPEQPKRIYAGTIGRGLFRSDDEGWHWAYKGADVGKDIQRIVIDPRGPQTTVYVLTDKGVFRSRDAGESWESYLSLVADIAPAVRGSLKPVVVTRVDSSYVTGLGVTEAVVVPHSRVAPGVELKGLTVSPVIPQVLYVLVKNQGVFWSTDLGASWASLGPGLQARELRALALSVDDPALILVGTDKGIYRYQSSD